MKKFLSILLALTLVFALVACGNEKDISIKNNEKDTSTKKENSYVMTEKWHYDADGYWLKCKIDYSNIDNVVVTRYSAPDTVERIYTFNNKGNILEDHLLYDGENKKSIFKYYNDNETLSETMVYIDDVLREKSTYDEHGNILTEKAYHNGDLRTNYSYKYKYDNLGNITESSVNKGEEWQLEYKHNYDKKGNLTYKEYYINNSLAYSTEYFYKNNLLIEEISYNDNRKKTSRTEYEYHEKNISKEIRYNSSDEIIQIKKNKYDKYGNLYSETFTGKDGIETPTLNKEYDESGKILKSTSYNSQGDEQVYLYEYDKHGNNTKTTIYDWEGELNEIYSYKFNKKNQCTEYTLFNNGLGTTKHYKYYYDKNGNINITVNMLTTLYSSEYDDFSKKYGSHSFTELKYEKVSKNIYVIHNKIKEYVPYF